MGDTAQATRQSSYGAAARPAQRRGNWCSAKRNARCTPYCVATYCVATGVGVLPWSPLARGRLTRDWDDATTSDRPHRRRHQNPPPRRRDRFAEDHAHRRRTRHAHRSLRPAAARRIRVGHYATLAACRSAAHRFGAAVWVLEPSGDDCRCGFAGVDGRGGRDDPRCHQQQYGTGPSIQPDGAPHPIREGRVTDRRRCAPISPSVHGRPEPTCWRHNVGYEPSVQRCSVRSWKVVSVRGSSPRSRADLLILALTVKPSACLSLTICSA